MKNRSPFIVAVAVLVSIAIVIPVDIAAQAGQKAGQVSRAIPDVAIARGTQKLQAPVKTLVDWGDVVNTNEGGRARVSLDDGSVLNVGSSSSLLVTQHNSAAQQTQIELTYGRMRSQVVKQAKPNAKFEVHTAVGVAGVVGTDFFLGYLNGIFQLIVFDGHVKFCNLDGACVDVLAGVHHIGAWTWVGMTILVAVPAIVIPIATRGHSPTPVLVTNGCSTNNPKACG